MRTSTSRGAELRFTTKSGGEDIAAHAHFRKDSENNFNLELHIPNLPLLQENRAQATQDIQDFFDSAKEDMLSALGLTEEA